MLDISFIRDNLELCKQAAIHKNRTVDWDTLLTLDERRRTLIKNAEVLRAKRNQNGKMDPSEGKKLKGELRTVEDELRIVEEQFNIIMLTIPNIPDESVPVGKNDKDNKEIRTWGTIPQFDFPVKDHVELSKKLDLIDFERGTKVGGFRAYFLKNEAALLEIGVLMYTMRKLVNKGFTPMIPPVLVRSFSLFGNGQFPWGKDEVYELPKDDLYLSGTAEVPITSYYADEIIKEEDLPKKIVAFSPCYRREAGSYGKDTKGVYRVHQFNKIEQVVVTKNDTQSSFKILEELLSNTEEILQDLKLPYRVMLMCTGDMGEPQVKKYDIEVYMPGRSGYGEIASDSFMGDFQARRLKIRYRTKDGKTAFCHTLNDTAIPSPRILVAILENYQQKDGSIRVPDVLVPFVGKEIITR